MIYQENDDWDWSGDFEDSSIDIQFEMYEYREVKFPFLSRLGMDDLLIPALTWGVDPL